MAADPGNHRPAIGQRAGAAAGARPGGAVFEEREGATGLDGAPVLRYTGAPKAPREPTRAEECARWLVEVLGEAGGPVKPKEIVR